MPDWPNIKNIGRHFHHTGQILDAPNDPADIGEQTIRLLEFPISFDDPNLSVADDEPNYEDFPGVELVALEPGTMILSADVSFPDGEPWDGGMDNSVDLYLGDGSGSVTSFGSVSLALGPGNGSTDSWEDLQQVISQSAHFLWKTGSLYAGVVIANGGTLVSGEAVIKILIAEPA